MIRATALCFSANTRVADSGPPEYIQVVAENQECTPHLAPQPPTIPQGAKIFPLDYDSLRFMAGLPKRAASDPLA